MRLFLNPQQTLRELERPIPWTAEQKIELEPVAQQIVLWQLFPDIALTNLSGIFIPVHERLMLYGLHTDHPTNVLVCSRGTSKSSVVCVLYANYRSLLFSKKRIVTLSATGFRGGQMIFDDAQKWINGGWSDQDASIRFFRRSTTNENIVKRAQNYWELSYDSLSTLLTLPTNDQDRIRGVRGHLLFIDESNTIDWQLVTEVAEPFLNVGTDFLHGGALSESNQVFYTTTIDYNWRPFQNVVRAAREGIQRDMAAQEANEKADAETYRDLLKRGLHRYQYISFDYTDLLLRETFQTRDGRTIRLKFPDPNIPLTEDVQGIPYLERNAEGQMQRHGDTIRYYRTYPIQKDKLEQGLFDGTSAEAPWLAEQRNIVEASSGNVYDQHLVDKATCDGQYCITPRAKMPQSWQNANPELSYCAPVLWECSDPVVIGVDYATQTDFSAFVVIRVGPLAAGDYNYDTHHGKTPWSNVIWAEQHLHTSHRDVADKLRELMRRYPNLAYYHDPYLDDTWQLCRGIGLDMRGGGSGVRDELAYINDDLIDGSKYRIYDPLDRDPRILTFATDPRSKPMLDAIWPTGELNDRLVTFTVAQMETDLLYIGKYLPKTMRPRGHRELDIGFEGVRGLASQLRKLQQEPTATWRRFFVEGDKAAATNKKDYWAGFIYASKQLRAHIIRQRRIDDAPPPLGAVMTQVNRRGGQRGRTPGTRGL